MSDDPRTDFFASGASDDAASTGAPADPDPRTSFFQTGNIAATQPGVSSEPNYDAAEFKRRVGRDPEPTELANFKQFKGEGFASGNGGGSLPGMGEAALATGASALKGISHAVNDILPDWGGSQAAVESELNTDPILNYHGGPEAQPYLQGVKTLMTPVTWAANKIHQGISNVAGTRAADVAGDIATLLPAARGTVDVPESTASSGVSTLDSPQSMGAARAIPSVENASMPLRRAIQQAGANANPDVLERHLEADQHGIALTEGQATRNAAQFSNEQNSTHPGLTKRIGDQNSQLTDAIDNIRREAAPGAVQNNPIENGQIAIDSLKRYDEPVRADIDQKYAAARAASADGDLQMDASSFINDANEALKPQSKFRFLPSTVKGILSDVEASGDKPRIILPTPVKGMLNDLVNGNQKMTLDDYQAYETQLGNEIAKAKAAGDGNAVAAIAKVKNALQKVQPLNTETADAKSLFDTARASAKARFDALDADPAYQAAVNDLSLNGVKTGDPSALADKFLDKYALQAPKANLDRLMNKLDPDARQAVAAHTLNAVRSAAIGKTGMVLPSGYSGAMEKYGPKLDSLISPQTQESLDSLGRVIHNVKVPPPGHFVNPTKSGVVVNAAQGVGSELGKAYINAKTFGMGMPIIKGVAENNFAKRALAPGAGLTIPTPTTPIARASGGKVDHEALVQRLIQRWKSAKKATDKTTEPLLRQPDAAIVRALEISQEHI